MNDRFKFRAWIAKYNKLVDVFRYGNDLGTCEWIWHSHIYDTPDGKPVLDNWGSVDERFSNIIERTKLIDCILEQCTGLKDKNGKLIYEGDILRSESYPFKSDNEYHYAAEVCFDEESAVFFYYVFRTSTKVAGRSEGNTGQLDEYEWEIIGNIHENADLLENEE